MERNKIWIGLTIGIIVYFMLIIYGDVNKILNEISTFRYIYIPLILSLAFLNYLVRSIKWHYFFKILHIDITFKENLYIFLSGFLMSITPGKVGEIWRSWLVKDLKGYEISKTVPIVFVDRLTDLTSLFILSSFGVLIFNVGKFTFSSIFFGIIVLISVLRSEKASLKIIGRFERVKSAYINSRDLLKLKPLIITVLISLIAWFFECFAFYITFRGLSTEFGIIESVFVYSFSSIAGALTMLPGGLGVTEASMTGLTQFFGIDKSIAVPATLIIRSATLWFAVVVGFLTYTGGRMILCRKSV